MLTHFFVFGVLFGPACCTELFTFAAEPQEVRLGHKVTITVDLSQIRILATESYVRFTRIHAGKRESRLIIEHNAKGCELHDLDVRVLSCLYAEHRYSIVFDSIKKENIGNYSLIAAAPPHVFSTIEIKLLPSEPEGVSIIPFNSTHLEREEVVLKCSVKSPGVFEFEWRRLTEDGAIVDLPTSVVVDESGPEGSYSSRLTWASIDRQDEGLYQCEASNEVGLANSEPTTVSVYHSAEKLDLEYHSKTNIVPAGGTVSLTCTSIGGHPEPGMEIYIVRTGTVIASLPPNSGRFLTTKRVVQKTDNGAEYACRTRAISTNTGVLPIVNSESVRFEVQFPPSRRHWTPSRSVKISEGSSVTLHCETPSSSNPVQNLSWIWSNGTELDTADVTEMKNFGYRASSNVTVLGDRTLNGIELNCTGTYYDLMDVVVRAMFDVSFPPRGISFYNTSKDPMIEHLKYLMHCRSGSSNPVGVLTWKIEGNDNTVSSFEPQGDKKRQSVGDNGGRILESSMEIIADRNANGAVVWCEVAYEFPNGTGVLLESEHRVLDVYYPVEVAVETDSTLVLEGDSVILHCDTKGGNPANVDEYEWSWNYLPLGEHGEKLVLDSIRSEQSAGLYRCTAWNKAGKASNSIHISVMFRPKLDPNSRIIKDNVVGDDQTTIFNMTVLANPKPTEIIWQKNGSDSPLGSRFVPGYYGDNYWLHIRDITPTDIGVYICRIRNEVGEQEFEFSLRPQGRPDPPTDFSIVSRSSTSLTMAFQSGFSGAKNQTILIEVKYPSKGISQGFEKFRVGTVTAFSSINYTLTDLEPGTEYSIRLMARNALGWESRHTKWVTGVTKVDINELFIDVEHVGAMVSVNWTSKTPPELFEDYPEARLVVLFMAENAEANVPTSTIDVDLSEGYLSFFVLNRQSYTFYVRVYDGTLKIFERIFIESQPKGLYTHDSSSSTIDTTTILTVVFVLLFLIAVILGVFFIMKYRRKFIRARNDSRSSNAKLSSYDNETYDDFNPEPNNSPERLEDYAGDAYATIPDTFPAVRLFPGQGQGGKAFFNKPSSMPEMDDNAEYVNVPESVAQPNIDDGGDDDMPEPGYMDMRQMAKKTQRIIERMSSEREGK